MDIRSCVRYVNPGEKLNVSTLWSQGQTDMDAAYNAATGRGIDYTYRLDDMSMVFFFVGGRYSLASFLAESINARLLVPKAGSKLGLIIDRKSYLLKKDKTAIGVCNIGIGSGYDVTPITSYRGKPSVLALDANGGHLTTGQLASIIFSEFFTPAKKAQETRQMLKATGIGW